MAPPPPSPPPADYLVSVLSAVDFDFLKFTGLSVLVYFIFTCCGRKYWNQRQDMEGGGQRQTVAPLPAVCSDGNEGAASTRLFQYGSERGMEGKNEDCSICLDEFTEGEICRMLLKCKHVFHRFCIDKWLPNRRHCPLCRSPVHVRISPSMISRLF